MTTPRVLVTRALVFGAISAVVFGGAGFLSGASIPDERAGEAALWLAKIGAATGFVLGVIVSMLL